MGAWLVVQLADASDDIDVYNLDVSDLPELKEEDVKKRRRTSKMIL